MPTAISQLPQLASDKLRIDHSRCLKVRNRNTTCHRCVDACTSGCLSFGDDGIKVDSSLCIGCGTCATVCPSAAIETLNPDDVMLHECALENSWGNSGEAILACERAQAGSAVKVTCLSRVDESLILGLLADGAQKVILVHGDCDACPEKSCIATARMVAKSANSLLKAWGKPDNAVILRDSASSDSDSSKPLPKAVHAKPADPVSEPALPKVDKRRRTLPQHLPARHAKVLESLMQMGEPQVDSVDNRLWGSVEIDTDACVSCQMCATFCTTGAIQRLPRAEGFGVVHTPQLCVQCGCCQDICPAGALKLSSAVNTKQLVEGAQLRIDMTPIEHPSGTPHGIMYRMRERLGTKLVSDF